MYLSTRHLLSHTHCCLHHENVKGLWCRFGDYCMQLVAVTVSTLSPSPPTLYCNPFIYYIPKFLFFCLSTPVSVFCKSCHLLFVGLKVSVYFKQGTYWIVKQPLKPTPTPPPSKIRIVKTVSDNFSYFPTTAIQQDPCWRKKCDFSEKSIKAFGLRCV